jgi:hypothetical protein
MKITKQSLDKLFDSEKERQKKTNLIKELVDELLIAAIVQDKEIKELDESIDPASYGQVVHLVLTLKELLNDKS